MLGCTACIIASDPPNHPPTSTHPPTHPPAYPLADEHYFPTLMATLGRENETYCDGNGVASANWTIQGPHPHHYL